MLTAYKIPAHINETLLAVYCAVPIHHNTCKTLKCRKRMTCLHTCVNRCAHGLVIMRKMYHHSGAYSIPVQQVEKGRSTDVRLLGT